MVKRMMNFVSALVLCASCSMVSAQQATVRGCEHDRDSLLALPETQFDQDMSGGWRALSMKPGCQLAAADLLQAYREAHRVDAGILFWHEGQLRANAGQNERAIALMALAHKPDSQDKGGWNFYVDATIAFLRKDLPSLLQSKRKLAAVAPPTGADEPPVVNGYVEMEFADGSKRKIRWPPNIDVVEGLERCFDKPYEQAYSTACRMLSEDNP